MQTGCYAVAEITVQTLRYIGLAGLGFLGRGIAKCLVDHGFHVVALDPDATAWQQAAPSERLIRAESARDMTECELVIETITENFRAKQALYDELESQLGSDVPIASNTSGFPITLLQESRRHPQRFAGMHWASPAEATRFLEIVRGDQTDSKTLAQIEALARELGKEPAIVEKDVPGFVANRIAYAMYREALHLLEEGVASVATIDLICRNSLGLWTPVCGPFRWMDVSGGPALYAKVMQTIAPTLSNEAGVPPTMQRTQSFYEDTPSAAAEWRKKLHDQALRLWASDQERS